MDLEVLKALGDETRYAMYRELSRSPVPRSAQDLAAELGLHPNTVRAHLERLREVGLVEVVAVHRGGVGRPQHRYALSPKAPSLGFDPPAHALLAGLLAALAEQVGAGAADATAVGAAWGRRAVRRTRAASCIAALAAELDRLGFEPAAEPDHDGGARIDFLHCPFRELAEAYPELVCSLHRGICAGVIERAGKGTMREFGALYDADPCHVTVEQPG